MKTIAKFVFLLLTLIFFSSPLMLPAAAMTMAAWSSDDDYLPYYSIYDGTTWSTAAQISDFAEVDDNVSVAYNPTNGKVVATWKYYAEDLDPNIGKPYYAVYSGGSWSTAAPIPSETPLITQGNVYITFNPVTESFIATWGDNDSPYHPYYAIFDADGTPSLAEVISDTYGVYYDVYTSVNTSNGDMIATWTEYNNDAATYYIYYSIYNGNSWSPAAQLGTSENTGAGVPTSIYDPTHDVTVATWRDGSSQNPCYAVYNGTSWMTGTISDSSIVSYLVFVSYNNDTQNVIATWVYAPEGTFAAYSIYDFDTNTWSDPGTISGLPDSYNVMNSFNPDLHETIATYSSGYVPYFSTYDGSTWTDSFSITEVVSAYNDVFTTLNYGISTPPPVVIDPPGRLEGYRKKNDFALVYEFFNTLAWRPSPSADVQGYHVYKDNLLIATLDKNTLSYQIHNIPKKEVTTYSVTAFNGSGESSPVTVTIYPKK